ncbi:MAG: helix-turn-helix transcriptional regulator [Alphaproteobacteria bacterium]|nr:helix-turn-helix transcriptional regulator [Alphaproteobacteria bacterium]MBV8410141.1 helix-turn-helix transcriptional regulator [Alphaproteobacteria bacterium]
MTGTALLALDWGLRGAACALVLLMAAALLREHGKLLAGRLGALFAVGTAAYAVTSATGFSPQLGAWAIPLLALSAGNNVVFWSLTGALFDDGFRLRWWHVALWLLLVLAGLAACVLSVPVLGLGLTLSSFGFAGLAMAQALRSWRGDLIERRRRLRLFVVAGSALYIGIETLAQLFGVPRSAPQGASMVGAIGLLIIAATIAWSLLRVSQAQSLFATAVSTPGPPAEEPVTASETADQGLLAALERVMATERAYRQEGLTIGSLAQQLGLPEYRLRRLINQELGHRNFNSFVNRYRIAEAKAALADLSQAEVPVLTIALDAGFSSLGPFNRAFKAETGMTPTEFRRANLDPLANSSNVAAFSESAGQFSNAARGNLAAS